MASVYVVLSRFLKSYSNRFVSRWVVLTVDLIIVLFSIIAAYILRYNFEIYYGIIDTILIHSLEVVAISAIVFLATRSYVGIIRHTGFSDLIKILASTTLIVLLIIVIDLINRFIIYLYIPRFPYSVLLIFYLSVTAVLLFFRLAVKVFYTNISKTSVVRTNILIYGAGRAGIIARNVLESDHNSPARVVGYIDNNAAKIGKTIDMLPVYDHKSITEEFIKKHNISQIIFAIHNISPHKRSRIIEELLQLDSISVKEVPPVDKWINGELTTRQIKKIPIEELLQRDTIKLNNKHILAEIEGKVVMITGAAGSIGSEMSRQLCHYHPHQLIFVDQAETPLFDLQQELKLKHPSLKDKFSFIIADISNQDAIERIFTTYKPHMIYHAAAYKHVPMMEDNPFAAVRVNVFGTKLIADLASRYAVDKFVMVSTDKAVNPTNVMGATKRLAEIYTQCISSYGNNRTKFITTRFGNVLGSSGSVIPIFEKQINEGGPVTITHPEITRFFMTIPEACQLVFEAGTMGNGGEIYLFDMGKPVKIVDLAHKMIRLSGYEPNKDIKIEFVGLRPGEKLYEELLNSEEAGLPTHHPKITIARVRNFDCKEVISALKKLHDAYHSNDLAKMIVTLKQIIPEYISNNSEFEKFDQVRPLQ